MVLLSAPALRASAAQHAGVVTGSVTAARTGAPVNATIRASGQRELTRTRADGTYRLRVDIGRHELQVRALGFVAETRDVVVAAGAETTQDFQLEPSPAPLDEVVTIGTRRPDRTVTRSMVPIDVISESLLESTGSPELWQALLRIVPSLSVPHYPLADGGMRPITLRGMNPDQVLVLVNGKRRHPAAVVESGPRLNGSTLSDINTIPTGAIDRIEVLRDGAAAQYGSDAIAGVVNVILKTGERLEARTSAGQVVSTEGRRHFRDGRDVGVTVTYGFPLAARGRVTVSAELHDRGLTNRAYPDARPQYFSGDPRNTNPPPITSHEGDGAAHDVRAFVNGDLALDAHTEAYAFGGVNRRDGSGRSLFRRANETRTVRALHPDGFLPELGSDVLDVSGVAGARGTLRGWRWDASSGVGRNSVRSTVHNSNNVSFGNASPTDFHAGRLVFSQWTTNVDVSRALNVGLATPVNVGLGAELRREDYEIGAGEPASYEDGGVRIIDGPSAGQMAPIGAQGNVGFRPIDAVRAHRSNVAAYVDLEGDMSRRLSARVAGRVERYSDFGSTTGGTIAARYAPAGGLTFRASAGTGFRAPSLMQSYLATTGAVLRVVNGVNGPRIIRTLPVQSAEARALGAEPLRAETSVNVSAGVVVEPARAPVITADFFAVDVDDRIVLSGTFDDPAVARLFAEQGLRGIDGGRFFTNAIDTRTRGVDVVASQGFLVEKAGMLRLSAAYNHARTEVTRVSRAPAPVSAFDSLLFGRVERGKMERGQPHHTLILSANYSIGRVALNADMQRFGAVSLLDATDPARDQTVQAKWIADLDLGYTLGRHWRAALSVNNLLDVYPDEWRDFQLGVAGVLSMNGVFRYPGGISPFGMNGRTVYARLGYR
ncbi:MAG: TonB-dependent receptor domain-containing protein [Gemmatimonadaceae bacterium]